MRGPLQPWLLCLVACTCALLCTHADGSAAAAAGGQSSWGAAATAAPGDGPLAGAAAAAQLPARSLAQNASSTAHPQKQQQQQAKVHQTSAAGTTAPRPKRHTVAGWKGRRRPCDPEDAKCIALRDHECDPYYQTVEDKCTFVQFNRHCKADEHLIAYLPLFYCRTGDGRALVALFFLAWAGVLFWLMASVAEDFLVPALEYLAYWLRMAPDVAGVTLFAFASGAPDLFTQIAAVAAGGHVDQELAISATLGGGLFIVAVIFSVLMLVRKPGEDSSDVPEILDRRAFVRDAVAYALSTLALLLLMLRGVFSAWEAGAMLVGFGAYLATCLLTSRGGVGGSSSGPGGGHRHAYFAVSPSVEQLQMMANNVQQLTAAQQQQLGEEYCGSRHNGAAAGAAGGADLPHHQQIELVSRVGGPLPQRKSTSRLVTPEGSRPTSPLRATRLGDASAGSSSAALGGGGGGPDLELAGLVGGLPPSDGGATLSPRGAAWRAKLPAGHSTRVGKLVSSASLGLEELLHTKGKAGPRLWLTIMMSPAMLVLHLTMPALHPGYYTPLYAVMLTLGAPLFMLLSTGLYPHHLTTGGFMLTWLLSAAVLVALLLVAVPPAGSSSSGGAGQPPSGAVAVAVNAAAAPLTSSPLGPAAASSSSSSNGPLGRLLSSGGRVGQRMGARRQRRNLLLAVLASVQCMLWMSVAADELVALFQAIGRICDISQDLLGATVLAWGEAVPELVATMSLARQGQGTMAIAAVFGGPIFNVLVAWAGPTLYAALRHGPMTYELSAGVSLLVLFTLLILGFVLLAFPFALRWRLERRAAGAILALFGLAQVLFLAKEVF